MVMLLYLTPRTATIRVRVRLISFWLSTVVALSIRCRLPCCTTLKFVNMAHG